MTLHQFLLITLVVGIGSVLQGAVGFGLGLFAVPFLVLIEPQSVPGPILLASGMLTMLMLIREHHALRRADLKWSLIGRVIGTLFALAVLVLVPPSALSAVFGALILLAVGLTASGLHLVPTSVTLAGAGVLSGFMATTVSIGGPPVALLYQHEPGPSIRATLSAFFLIGALISIVGLSLIGRFGMTEIVLTASMLPGIAIGFVASRRLANVLDRGLIRPAILVVSATTGIIIFLKSI